MKKGYEDIINLPHHVSKKYPQMSMFQRVTQFAPFDALSGYEESIGKRCEELIEFYHLWTW